jgi:ribosome-associated heat shock protein Hsp15
VPEDTRQRLDKWLWFGRFVKTRVLAAELVAAGHVRINRTRVMKPGHDVRAGDVLTVAIHGRVRVVRITGLAARRGSPELARMLYEELTSTGAHAGAAENMDASSL